MKIVKFSNDLNEISLTNFTKNTQSLLMTTLYKLKDKEDRVVEIDYKELVKLSKIKVADRKSGYGLIEKMRRDLIKIGMEGMPVKKEGKLYDRSFNLFSYIDIEKETGNIQVALNADFSWLLNDLVKGFTALDLEIYTGFGSEYTQKIYTKIRQFRATGYFKIGIEAFRLYMDVPKSYSSMSNLDKFVLAPIKKDLKKHYKRFEIKKVTKKSGRGRPKVVGLEFYFDKEKIEHFADDKYTSFQPYEKPEIEYTAPQYPTKKEAKTGYKQSNVPEWSNPDYKNTATPEEKEQLKEAKREMLERMRNGDN